jgi:signal recognition particle subunit SRP72
VLNNNIIFMSNNIDIASEYYKSLEEFNDPKTKLRLMQLLVLRINKLSYLNKKNRIHDAIKIVRELEGQPRVLTTNEFIMNKYYALKKTKDYENAEKYIRTIIPQNMDLGFCLLADLCKETHDTKPIIDFLQVLSKVGSTEDAKNYIFSLLIKDSNLFEQYSGYLDGLIQKSTEVKILEILLKLYKNKKDKGKLMAIYNRMLLINPKNTSARVGLAEIYMEDKELAKAEDLLKGIEKPAEITDHNYLQYIEKNIHVSKKEENAQVTEEEKRSPHKKRIKKKKRVKLPKAVEKPTPNFKPDPERWLPKWQRKGYKKKGKRGTNKTQGLSTVGAEEKSVFNAGNTTSTKEVTKERAKRRN